MSEPETQILRFADILTTAASVADYMGVADVTPEHVRLAVTVLRDEVRLEDLGRPVSPMLKRPGERRGVVGPLRAVVQEWFARLEGDVNALLNNEQVEDFLRDAKAATGDDDPEMRENPPLPGGR